MMNLRWWIIGYFVAVGIALLSPLASSSPDGLEKVAEDQGYIDQARDPPFAIIPDYVFPGIENEAVATVVAGVVGVTIIYALVAGLAYLAYRRSSRASNQTSAQ